MLANLSPPPFSFPPSCKTPHNFKDLLELALARGKLRKCLLCKQRPKQCNKQKPTLYTFQRVQNINKPLRRQLPALSHVSRPELWQSGGNLSFTFHFGRSADRERIIVSRFLLPELCEVGRKRVQRCNFTLRNSCLFVVVVITRLTLILPSVIIIPSERSPLDISGVVPVKGMSLDSLFYLYNES